MLSKIMDKPVKVICSREDDVKRGAYRPLAAQHLDAAIAADGKITGWSHRLVADSVLARSRKLAWEKIRVLMIRWRQAWRSRKASPTRTTSICIRRAACR